MKKQLLRMGAYIFDTPKTYSKGRAKALAYQLLASRADVFMDRTMACLAAGIVTVATCAGIIDAPAWPDWALSTFAALVWTVFTYSVAKKGVA